MRAMTWRPMMLGLALAGMAVSAKAAGGESGRAREATPRPNFLFVIMDDWGWQHAGAYGCTWVKTPTFDRLAREGLLFRNAFTSNPKCSPCRASILTGRNTWQLEEASCHFGVFPAKFTVFPDVLEEAGYWVGYTGKGWGPGDAKAGGFTRNPAGPEFAGATQQVPASGISRKDYAANFKKFLDQRPAGAPFYFWLGTHEPHRGYELHSGRRLGKDPAAVTVPPYLPDNEVIRGDLLDYAVEVEWADAQAGRAIALLETAGELENTLVVMTSDHGMPFPRVKGQIVEDGFHLPMAARWGRGIRPGRVVEDFINVRDLAPTFLALAGIESPPGMTGHSLADLLRSEKSGWVDPGRNTMLTGKERHDLGRPNDAGYPVRAIRTPDYLYVHSMYPDRWPAGNPETDYGNCDPGPTKEWIKAAGGFFYDLSFGKRPEHLLYRLSEDPGCVQNLAADPEYADTARRLGEQMDTLLRADGDPRALGNGDIFDTYRYVGGRAKAYDTWLRKQQENDK